MNVTELASAGSLTTPILHHEFTLKKTEAAGSQ